MMYTGNNMRGIIIVYDNGFFVAGKVKKAITAEITVDSAPKLFVDDKPEPSRLTLDVLLEGDLVRCDDLKSGIITDLLEA
jgi:hypothetical protein